MGYKITLSEIERIISKIHFDNDGDIYEKSYWTFLKERFPNCEEFWKYLVVPSTKRIEPKITDPDERIRPRKGISEDIKDIASFHYSMFLHLIYSYEHLQNPSLSSFEDFYMHLGSACDLAEKFLLKTYLLILECTNQKSQILQELEKENFLKKAEKWYDNNYSKVHEDFLKLKKGEIALRLFNTKSVLDEYFKGNEEWKEYKRHSQKIREYRNIIVHDAQIGRIILIGRIVLVPKKEKIQDYKKWSDVFAVRQDIQKLKNDFINMKEQMILDIGRLEIIFNSLWTKPINDMKKLFFADRNEILLEKYNIDLT